MKCGWVWKAWKLFRAVLSLGLAVALLTGGLPLRVTAQDDAAKASGATVTLLEQDAGRVSFQVTLPLDRLRLERLRTDAGEWVRALVAEAGTTRWPGAPELPALSVALGVPFGSSLSVQTRTSGTRRLALDAAVAPVPTERAVWDSERPRQDQPSPPRLEATLSANPDAYASQIPYPAELAVVSSDGVVRYQRVVGVTVYPVQYDARTRELIVHQQVVVEVGFGTAERPTDSEAQKLRGSDGDPFDEVLRATLLNYESARAWRQRAPAPQLDPGLPWIPPSPGWRVLVEQEGIYRLTRDQLSDALVPVDDLDPRTLRMYFGGQEVAIHVEGEGDGSLGAGDYVLFYGRALSSKYTRYNVYWLTYGQGAGLRMASREGPLEASPALLHADLQHMEPNVRYYSDVPGDEDLERFMWTFLGLPGAPSRTHTFTLTNPVRDAAQTATLKLRMFARTGNSGDPNPILRVSVNGFQVADQVTWPRGTWHEASIGFDQSKLNVGANVNSLKIERLNVGPLVLVDWVRLEYANNFTATADRLGFRYGTAGAVQYEVDGFSGDQIAAFDVGDPGLPVRIFGVQTSLLGGSWAASFTDQVTVERRYEVLGEGGYLSPASITGDTVSSLESPGNQADYVLIAHSSFVGTPSLASLRARREAAGMSTMEIDVQNVYDQFSFGVESARAIHDFLAYALAEWDRPPSYVILVGDGTDDPKDYRLYGRTSFVPPYLAPVDPWLVETAADNRYVTLVGGDIFPDMILGRLAVNSPAELEVVAGKTVSYEVYPEPGMWKQGVLFVADDADLAGNFAALSDGIVSCCLPPGYQPTRVYHLVTHPSVDATRAALQAAYAAGQFIVNYIGHAGTDAWAGEGLLMNADLPALQNGANLPIMLPMTCLDGHYQYPYPTSYNLDSLGEQIVRVSGRGAVASWSPTGLGVASGHDQLNRGFFDGVFTAKLGTVGQATMVGKLRLWQTGTDLDTIDTYVLLGDPALRVNYAPTAVFLKSFDAVPASDRSMLVRWETESEVDNLGFNLYRAVAEGGPRTKLNETLIPSQVPPGSVEGAAYEFLDPVGGSSGTVWYWLEDVDIYGKSTRHGPVRVSVTRSLLPVAVR